MIDLPPAEWARRQRQSLVTVWALPPGQRASQDQAVAAAWDNATTEPATLTVTISHADPGVPCCWHGCADEAVKVVRVGYGSNPQQAREYILCHRHSARTPDRCFEQARADGAPAVRIVLAFGHEHSGDA